MYNARLQKMEITTLSVLQQTDITDCCEPWLMSTVSAAWPSTHYHVD